MSTYLIGQLSIHGREEYQKYGAGFSGIFSKYKGEILVVDEDVDVIEGEWPYTRTVVIRFEDEDEARNWYNSPEYQELAQHRFRSSKANIIFAKGFA